MFSRIVFLFVAVQVSPVAAFAPLQHRTTGISTAFGRLHQLYAVEDLEAKLLGESPKPVAAKAKAPVKDAKPAAPVATSTKSDLSLLKSEMPQYESTTTTATSTPKVKPEKQKPIPKPKPAPVPKAVQPAPAPKVEKPKPVVVEKPKRVAVEKPKPVVVEKPKPKPVAVVKKPLPPPPKPKPAVEGDFQTIATGVALGGAPLALGALGALAAARGALAGTAARREKIQEQIAAREAQKNIATQQEIDAGGVVTAGVLIGAAGASLALIIANPFGNNEGVQFSLPISLPSISLPSGGSSTPVASETKPPSPTDLVRAKIRAEQTARLEEKRAVNEAKRAELAKKGPPPRATVKKATSEVKEVDSYDALFKKAASAGPQSSAVTKEAKVMKEAKAAVSAATLADSDAKAALDEAKSLTSSQKTAAPTPAPAPKVDIPAVEKAAEDAVTKAEAEAAAAAKQVAIDLEKAAKAAKEAAEIEKKMIAAEKAAIAAKEADAVKKAAEVDVKAKEEAAAAKAVVKVDAKVEAVAAQKVAETKMAAEAVSSADTPSGGRVLPKEEVSAETMAFLKTLKKEK